MNTKQKLNRVLGVTGWTKDHLADLLGASNMAVGRWLKGRSEPKGEHLARAEAMYAGIVQPLECEIDRLADEAEKRILRGMIAELDGDNCAV